jgi:hypothetical protein
MKAENSYFHLVFNENYSEYFRGSCKTVVYGVRIWNAVSLCDTGDET